MDQHAIIFEFSLAGSKAWAEANAAAAAEANRKRSESQKGVPKGKKERPATTSGDTFKRDSKAEQAAKSSTAKAKTAGTNRGAQERAKKLIAEDEDLARHLAAGVPSIKSV